MTAPSHRGPRKTVQAGRSEKDGLWQAAREIGVTLPTGSLATEAEQAKRKALAAELQAMLDEPLIAKDKP